MDKNEVNKKVQTSGRIAIAAVVCWFAAAFICGYAGLTNEPGRPPLVVGSFIIVPIVGFVVVYLLSPSLRTFAQNISMTLLVGSHLWRFVGIGFVMGWLKGILPAGFAVPAGFGDIIVALGALLLIPSIRKGTATRGWLFAWNTVGIIDLILAIVLGLLYSESKLGILTRGGVSTRPMSTFPVSMIPTFFVPLFIVMHMLTFKRIADPNLFADRNIQKRYAT
jgi:hypothetical protein